MIRAGIPYGSDYVPGEVESPETKRGLLFACYQGFIEDGFQHMQSFWSNNGDFPPGKGAGVDPIVGQVPDGEEMRVDIGEGNPGKERLEVVLPTGKERLVTFRGGEYFFVPSIKALRGVLSDAG
jgi:deferrochelatase/peroxidase EfeB